MAVKRAAERGLKIPLPKNIDRRLRCLANPELFLVTYFDGVFFEPFTNDRRDMITTIINAAMYGGDQAIAGPRGEGKTRLAIYVSLFLMIAGLSRFPIVIGKSQSKAQSDLKTLKDKLQQSELFIADFPEIGIPFKAVGGWSSRARMQTVSGEFTNIELAADHLIFPTITRDQLRNDWPDECEPCSNGQIIGSVGIDGPIRGTTFRDERPTIAIIDDIEDREAATSDVTIAKNEEVLEQDIAGLGGSARRVSRVMLCTTQNRKCIAYKYTDPKQKSSWKGRRYRKMIKPPDRMDLVETYLEKRKERGDNDPDAREAYRYWRDAQTEIEAGCVVSNIHSFDKRLHADGEVLELSAIQSYYNRVADMGAKAVATEIDNDPPEESGPVGSGLTSEIVKSRISGLARRQIPASTIALTAAIDVGKYRCYWVVAAWWKGAGGCIVDYGVAEVTGTEKESTYEANEQHIYRTLLGWRDELLQKKFVDGSGVERKIDLCLVDSGTYTNAAYEFSRQVRGIFHPSKGINPYHPKKKSTTDLIAGANMHAAKMTSQNVWLYELDTNYWKQWVHERFLTPTFDDDNMLRRGALSLFQLDGNQKHNTYAHHIVAEELQTEFREGKGVSTKWNVVNEVNHWLDATYMASAAGEACGVKMIAASEMPITPRHVDGDKPKPKPAKQQPHGRFRQRQGGGPWVPKRR